MVGLCRLCASLRKMEVLITIKDESNEICEKLRKCCQLKITMQDSLPKSICQECIEKLNTSHKFYTKVQEAQETLLTLYPSQRLQKENENVNNDCQSTLAETLSTLKDNPTKRKITLRDQEKQESTRENKKLDMHLKQIKLEKCSTIKTKVPEEESTENEKCISETKPSKKNCLEEVYEMLDMTKEEAILSDSYEILETIEENVSKDLTEEQTQKYYSYEDVYEQQENIIEEHHVLEQDSVKDPITVLNITKLQPAKVTEDTEVIILPDKNLNIAFEYVDDYEDEAEDDELSSKMYNGESVTQPISSLHHTNQLSSWKSYNYLCFICNNKFSNSNELRIHIQSEHEKTKFNEIPYKCYDCQKIIPRYNFFLNHVRSKHHPDLKLRCEVCDLRCQNFEELSYHRSINCTEAKNYSHILPCNQCFKSFHNAYGLQNHCKNQHTHSKGKVKYKCNECLKVFQYKSCLNSHAQVHIKKEKFICNICDSTFNNKSNLEQHLYVHIDEKKFKCNICHKNFKTFLTLDQHQILHTENKPFKCDYCDKCFHKKIQKLVHERIHTGVLPFPCEQCNKRFRYRSALNAHRMTHTGDKPYLCEYCDKTFADSSNRNKHVRRKHPKGEKNQNIQI